MKFIVKLHPEIVMKSQAVRKRFTKVLAGNIRHTLRLVDDSVAVVQHWDFIEVRSRDETRRQLLLDALQHISGIHHILEVNESSFDGLHDIYEQVLSQVADRLVDKSFCVRVKRRGKHEFNSMDVMRYVGGGLNQAIPGTTVNLTDPELIIHIEIDGDRLMLVKARFEGLGGFPMSTQEDVLSLISGGFDSAVASYEFMRRGSRVHFVFFNLGGQAHEEATRKIAHSLWQRYSRSHKVKFVSIDFAPVVEAILTGIPDGLMGVILKRMMVRAASRVAHFLKIPALVTGEAMGQVSSQTLTNLSMIDRVSDTLILRPIITHDKAEIMAVAQRIGAFDIAKDLPEFCGVISKKPTVKARLDDLVSAETGFDMTLIDKVVKSALVLDIRTLAKLNDKQVSAPIIHTATTEMIIDIRSPMEADDRPLVSTGAAVICIPFFKLAKVLDGLDKTQPYALYCHQGVMSRLQAMQMLEQGFDVKVLIPKQ